MVEIKASAEAAEELPSAMILQTLKSII
jgi:hypothetical protein